MSLRPQPERRHASIFIPPYPLDLHALRLSISSIKSRKNSPSNNNLHVTIVEAKIDENPERAFILINSRSGGWNSCANFFFVFSLSVMFVCESHESFSWFFEHLIVHYYLTGFNQPLLLFCTTNFEV